MSNEEEHRWLEGESVTRRIVAMSGSEGLTDDGLMVFGVFPPERVEARVLHVGKRKGRKPRVTGKPLRILERHPHRRLTPCPNARRPEAPKQGGVCDGCPLMPLEEAAQRELKREALERDHGLTVGTVHAAPAPFGYRMSSKRVAFGSAGRLSLGSWQRGSHKPATMDGCMVDHPRIATVMDAIGEAARELAIPAYDERSGNGVLRYVWAKTDGETVLVTLITATEDREPAEAIAERVQEAEGFAWSIQSGAGNAMRGSTPVALRGPQSLSVPIGDRRVEVGPDGFLQPNPAAIDQVVGALLSTAEGEALKGERAIDLYAGAGLTTERLRQSFASVEACEVHPEGAAALGVEPQSAEDFLAARTGEAPAVVIANPPRAGMGAAVCAHLLALGAPHIQLMSCGPAGLARDLKRLAEGYELERIDAWDTLPQTPHVEIVAWLRRRA